MHQSKPSLLNTFSTWQMVTLSGQWKGYVEKLIEYVDPDTGELKTKAETRTADHSPERLTEMINNFYDPTQSNQIPVYLFHERHESTPAVGWILDLKLEEFEEGSKLFNETCLALWARIEFDPDVLPQLMKRGLAYFSPEYVENNTHQKTGKRNGHFLTGLAATNLPFVTGQLPISFESQRIVTMSKENIHRYITSLKKKTNDSSYLQREQVRTENKKMAEPEELVEPEAVAEEPASEEEGSPLQDYLNSILGLELSTDELIVLLSANEEELIALLQEEVEIDVEGEPAEAAPAEVAQSKLFGVINALNKRLDKQDKMLKNVALSVQKVRLGKSTVANSLTHNKNKETLLAEQTRRELRKKMFGAR